jgi:hypothetical protein
VTVLNFRRSSPISDGHLRRERRHLLVLVMALGFVLVVVENAWHPETWRWLWTSSPRHPTVANRAQIDNRLEGTAGEPMLSEKLDVPPAASVGNKMRRNAASEARTAVATIAGDQANPDNKVSPSVADDAAAATTPNRSQTSLSELQTISLGAIRDDRPSSVEERDVSLRLLNVLNNTGEAALRKTSVGPVSYAQLFRQSEAYRGKLVTVSGIVHRAHRLELAPNSYGIDAYYQVWLFPNDNPASPVVAYCLWLPEDFPLGMEIAESVSLTGLFFKRWAYQAQDTVRTAPSLLARTLHWTQSSGPRELPTSPMAAPVVIGTGILLTGLFLGYVYLRWRPRRESKQVDQSLRFEILHEAPQNRTAP